MKNKINKILNLILLLSMLNGNVLPMRENDIEPNTQAMAIDQDVQQELSLLGLPAEVIGYILYQIIEPYEDRMKNVNNIFEFYSQQLDLKPLVSDLSGVSLTSKGLRLWTLDLIDRLKKLKARKYQELVKQIKDQYQGISEDRLNSGLRNILNQVGVNKDNLEEAAKLILAGANVNEKNNDGGTALIFAALKGYKDIVQLLISNGANVDEKDNDEDTALVWAAMKGYEDIVQLLISNGANVDEKDNDGDTALILAALKGHEGVAELLINKRANVNDKEEFEFTALMYAAINGHKGIVQLLIDHGANVDQMDDGGNTALVLATRTSHKDIVQLLEAAKNKENQNN